MYHIKITTLLYMLLLGAYGFADIPHGCVDRECDRDSVCLKRARALLRKSSHAIEVQR